MKKKPAILDKLVALASLSLLLLAASCAKQGFPNGGPKDTDAPKVLGCRPQNERRNFDGKQFYIEFDEYVVLKDASNNVLVSPPMKVKPEYTTKGKGVLVRLNDTLQANTTYLFQFKDAIADFTEGNLLPSFEYVFSTGTTMDTMMLAGRVLQARNGKPWEEAVSVMAYREERFVADSCDTIAIWGQPDLITRTDKEGHFAFHYIPEGRYRLVALADKNRDLKAAPAEAIAWDTTFYASTDIVDSLNLPMLRISAPDTRRQRVLKAEFKRKGHAVVSTALPMSAPRVEGDSVVWRQNVAGDTLFLWVADRHIDTMHIVVIDSATALCDTLRLRYTAPSNKRGRSQQSKSSDKQTLMSALCAGSNAFYDDLWLAFANPIATCADSLFAEVMSLKDSSVSHCKVALDSSGTKARLLATLHSGEKYRIRLCDSLFTDIFGDCSDSLTFTLTPNDYAILSLQLNNHSGAPLVVEVLDNRDTVVAHKTIGVEGGSVRFTHLKSGEYRLRAVIDADSNGAWTPGDYRMQRQPEQCVLYEKKLQLREKWEIEERWTIGSKPKALQKELNPIISTLPRVGILPER